MILRRSWTSTPGRIEMVPDVVVCDSFICSLDLLDAEREWAIADFFAGSSSASGVEGVAHEAFGDWRVEAVTHVHRVQQLRNLLRLGVDGLDARLPDVPRQRFERAHLLQHPSCHGSDLQRGQLLGRKWNNLASSGKQERDDHYHKEPGEKENLGNVGSVYLCDVLGRGSNPLELGLCCLGGCEGAAQAWDVGEIIPFEILWVVEERSGGVARLEHVAVGFGMRHQRTTSRE